YIVDPANTTMRGTSADVQDSIVKQLLSGAESSSSATLTPDQVNLINLALSSAAGQILVDGATDEQFTSLMNYAQRVAQVAAPSDMAFATSTLAQLFFCDFGNEYGPLQELVSFIQTGTFKDYQVDGPLGVDSLLGYYFRKSTNIATPWI
ncbi:MAG: hypothetical protein ACREBW_10015, partial [Candidatus Micrarchaeaceae archaeon]